MRPQARARCLARERQFGHPQAAVVGAKRTPAADVDYRPAITVAMVLVAYQLTVGLKA